jgi:riboflavin kinase / FMN adenylyltransferase
LEIIDARLDKPQSSASAVSIGKFDCLHIGHQALIGSLVDLASKEKLVSTVVSFDKHPDFLLRPESAKLPILGPVQKRELISRQGIERYLELEFNGELAALTATEFVEQVLVQKLNTKLVLVGEGFRFGNQGQGDCNLLRELGSKFGFEVKEIPATKHQGEIVSTTRVRELLDRGEVSTVNQLIARTHQVTGLVEHGLKIGRKIGFPTANIDRSAEGYLPMDGVYGGWLVVGDRRYLAAHSVGINETFQAVPRLVESHVLGETDLDLYDQIVSLEFVEFIRPAEKFDGVDDLVRQINLDLSMIREKLG